MTKLNVIICSTRPTRKGPAVAGWFNQFALSHGKFETELVDLASFNLPVFDEPDYPAKRQYQNDHTKAWSASVSAADAYVFVTPEYNHYIPPSLLNAMDYLYHEWTYKPCAFVSYAGQSGGTRSVEAAKLLTTTFRMVPIVEGVAIPFFDRKIDEQGVFLADETLDKSAKSLLDELSKWAETLKTMRMAK